MIKQVIIAGLVSVALTGCKTETKEAKIVEPVVATEAKATIAPTQDYSVGAQVPNDLVCMVNDAYMGKLQIPVPVNGKTYYGCCQMCVGTLNNVETARIATDPFSGNPIDKTEAFIVLINTDGDVAYFESEPNYQNFRKSL